MHAEIVMIGTELLLGEITDTNATLLARMLSLALLGDFVSLYLAALNGEDPYTIASIDLIKERLSKA